MDLFSVPHTGTLFLKDLLRSNGVNVRARHWEAWKPTEELIVAPIRNPYDTYVSWVSRERKQHFITKWKIFNIAYLTQDLVIIPIDTIDRDEHLTSLSKRLGKELKTEWKPINQGPRKKIDFPDLMEVYNLPVVKQFYKPHKPTRKDIEKIVRKIISSHSGTSQFQPNLFNDSVDQLMQEYSIND